MQNTQSLTRQSVRENRQDNDREERLRRELAREWAHDPSARWLLALDGAIRRAARAVAACLAAPESSQPDPAKE